MDHRKKITLIRINRFLTQGVGECTGWKGAKNKQGYPRIWYEGDTQFASRVMWEIHNGPIPPGLIVRHKCDNPECLKLEHLELGTHKENTDDARIRGRLTGPRRITPQIQNEINALRAKGFALAWIAKKYNVSVSSLYNYLKDSNKRHGNYATGPRW